MEKYKNYTEYNEILQFYNNKVAKRNNVPLINHINEGIEILENINSSDYAIRAFMLHPIFQSDENLISNFHLVNKFDSNVIALVIEYRRAANNYLCKTHTDHYTIDDIKLHVGNLLPDIKNMLYADKKQNQKDFLLYHVNNHERSNQLEKYFSNWLSFLVFN
jgi:hypothetical protein